MCSHTITQGFCGRDTMGGQWRIQGGATGGHGPPKRFLKKIFFTLLEKIVKKIFFLHYFLNFRNYYPPSNSNPRNLIPHGLPRPRNRAGKLHQLPPLEFTEPHRLPPLEIGPENSINYPPSNSRPERKFAPPKFNS